MIEFAIIVPIYNTEKHLVQCLDSLCQQTYKNFIAILVNDGSTDQSMSIAMRYIFNDRRFILVDKPNGGASTARNVALDMLDGKYTYEKKENNTYVIANSNPYSISSITSTTTIQFSPSLILFLDSDDFLGSGCLDFYQKHWKDTHAEIICTQSDIFDLKTKNFFQHTMLFSPFLNKTSVKGIDIVKKYKDSCFFAGTSICIDFAFLKRIQLRYINSIIFEDHHFGTLLFLQANNIAIYQDVFYHINLSQDSVTRPIYKTQDRHILEYSSWLANIENLLCFSKNTPFQSIIISQIKKFYLIALLRSFCRLDLQTRKEKIKDLKKLSFLFDTKMYVRIIFYTIDNLWKTSFAIQSLRFSFFLTKIRNLFQ